MKSKTKVVLAVSAICLCLGLLGMMGAAWWYVSSGRFKELIEARVAQNTGMTARMESVRFAWPSNIEIENLSITHPNRDAPPLLACPRLKISATPWGLMRKRIDSVTAAGPIINLIEDEGGGMGFPSIPSAEKPGSRFSMETIKVIDGAVDIRTSFLNANMKGILATYGKPFLVVGGTRTLKLNIDAAKTSFGADTNNRTPIDLKYVQSKFVLRPKPQGLEIEGEVRTSVTTKVPYLLLPPDIPTTLSFELDYFPGRDSLENAIFSLEVPLYDNISVFGSVTNLTSGAPVPDLNITVEAPQVAQLNEYNELLQRPTYEDMKMTGRLKISGELKASFSDPHLSLTTGISNGELEWKGATVKAMEARIPVKVEPQGLSVGPGLVTAEEARVPVGEEFIQMTALSGQLAIDKSRASISDFTATLGATTTLALEGEYDFATNLTNGKARLKDAPLKNVMDILSPFVPQLPQDLDTKGRFNAELDVETELASPIERLNAVYRLSLAGGEISMGEFMAAAGVEAQMKGVVETRSFPEDWKFAADGYVGGFELLVDSFYEDFSEYGFPFSFSGLYEVEAKNLDDIIAAIDLSRIGKMTVEGSARFASALEAEVDLKSDGIDLGELFDQVGEQLSSEVYPILSGAKLGGVASGKCTVRVGEKYWGATGRIELADGHMVSSDKKLSFDAVSANLPFDIEYPLREHDKPVEFAEKDYGSISIKRSRVGPVDFDPLDLTLALKKNAVRIKGPTSMNLFGGTFELGEINAENILSAKKECQTSMSAYNIDIGSATEALGLPHAAGIFSANFPAVDVDLDLLTTEGSARAEVFDGTIDITSFRMEKPFSPIRSYMGDFEFRDIDLASVTETLSFGAMKGIIEGTLSGLEVAQGQPAAFIADFETVKTRGVQQRISFDAVENITILGTGRGFQASIGRGFASFFEDFGYDKIGFYCTLKNDNFRMNGKVVSGDKEYFVKGVAIGPSINVINRNPGQTVSFKSMLERINRIRAKQANKE